MKNKLTFYLLGSKGHKILQNVLQEFPADAIGAVIVGTDKAIASDFSGEIRDLCLDNNITCLERSQVTGPPTLNNNGLSIAVGWKWIIEDMNNLVVIHDSLLPKYRGFCPLVNMLINGETVIGATAIFAAEAFDCGSIISQKSREISYPLKIKAAIQIVESLYCELVSEIIATYLCDNELASYSQDESQASYSLWRDNADYEISWDADAETLCRFVDAVGWPYLGAQSTLDGRKIRINQVEQVDDVVVENRDVGKVLFFRDGFPVVVCGTGLLKITDANFDDSQQSIFPMKRFRSRFGC